MGDLCSAMKQLTINVRLAALYFLTDYTRDVLYPQVLWGVTHQAAVEDFVMTQMNARFDTNRQDMTKGHKTCVGQLYGQIYNRKKQKLHQAILRSHIALAICRNTVKKPPYWRRPKEVFFVHTTMKSST